MLRLGSWNGKNNPCISSTQQLLWAVLKRAAQADEYRENLPGLLVELYSRSGSLAAALALLERVPPRALTDAVDEAHASTSEAGHWRQVPIADQTCIGDKGSTQHAGWINEQMVSWWRRLQRPLNNTSSAGKWASNRSSRIDILRASIQDLSELIELVRTNKINDFQVELRVEAVVKLGERLPSSKIREALWEAFGVPCRLVIVSPEGHLLAQECEVPGWLHTNEQAAYFELVGEDETRELVVTVLAKTTSQPLVRIKTGLGTRASLLDVCACGYRARVIKLEEVEEACSVKTLPDTLDLLEMQTRPSDEVLEPICHYRSSSPALSPSSQVA